MTTRWEETTIAPFEVPRERIEPTRRVRSTLIAASIQSLRQRGHFDDYRTQLTDDWADKLISAPAGTWLPIDHAEAHYAACDELGLDDERILGMGGAVAALTQKTVFSMTARLAREAGTSPTSVLAITPRLWSRLYEGGAVGASQTGPKDARFETVGISLAKYRYFRVAYRGIIHSISAPFCRSIFVRELPDQKPGRITFKLSWA